MKDEDDDALGLDLQARMRSSLDLEYIIMETSQENVQQNIPTRGYISASNEERKEGENYDF